MIPAKGNSQRGRVTNGETEPAMQALPGGVSRMGIAVQWVVFAEHSNDAMVATGITDKPSSARWIVETIMTEVSNAGWGEVLRVPVPGETPADAELSEWPPPGEIYLCRRVIRGGYKWMPLFPVRPDDVSQLQSEDTYLQTNTHSFVSLFVADEV